MRRWWGLPAVLVDEEAVFGVSAHPDSAPKMGLWVRCLQVMVRLGLDTRSNESVPVWRAPEGPEGAGGRGLRHPERKRAMSGRQSGAGSVTGRVEIE